MNKQPDIYVELALRALERVPRFLAERSLDAYLADDLCQSAVERQLEIAGDALGQLRKLDPAPFCAGSGWRAHRGFPQCACARLRNAGSPTSV